MALDWKRINKHDVFRRLPEEWPVDLRPRIRSQVKASRSKVAVLDDDPTGTQTVHGVPVLTEWSVEALREELSDESSVFYVLTNSRSLALAQAQSLNAEIGRNLVDASRHTNREFVVVSRGDSTLRGHFPGEVEALANALGQAFDGWIINPFFLEGGRYTIGDIHYVDEEGSLVPAAETEFAGDSAFGYRSSNLRRWVEEKTNGRISTEDVISLSIEDIRCGGPEEVTKRLVELTDGGICVVNAASYRDLEVFVAGLLEAEARGKRFLYRTAASFVQVRAGLSPRPLLTRSDFTMSESGGGLIIVGSYVPRTTSQVNALLAMRDISGRGISVEGLLDDGRREDEIVRVAQFVNAALQGDGDVVIYTSREYITNEDSEESLGIGNRISEGIISILRLISARPRYLVAKGGITASDVATRGLSVKRAMVPGQILPGVPVWQLGPESRYPGMPYIVFPGNVGGSEALADVVRILKPAKEG
jgi:uncharacterized protein YgbK (DUF1537 family)